MQEKMKDIKRELIEKGKKKGVLTFKEISDAFEDIEVTPEEIERLYDVFEKESIELVSKVYAEMLRIEKSSGVDASFKYLINILESKGVSYDEFIFSL